MNTVKYNASNNSLIITIDGKTYAGNGRIRIAWHHICGQRTARALVACGCAGADRTDSQGTGFLTSTLQ